MSDLLSHPDFFWATKISLILIASLSLSFSIDIFLTRLKKRLQRNRNPWDDLLVESAIIPAKSLTWILGLILILKTSSKYFNFEAHEIAILLKNISIVFCISWFLWRFVSEYENFLFHQKDQKNHIDVTTVNAVAKLFKALIATAASLTFLQTIGVNITGILALGGIGGIALGFASKDLLANFFGAFTIYLDRPFSVGDWIRSPDREIEGSVEYIGWRLTRIRTTESRLLYIPNSIFGTIAIENFSRMLNRRINETIGLRYNDIDKAAKIIDDVKEMLSKHPEIEQFKPIVVNLNKFDSSSLTFFINAFTKTTDFEKFSTIKQEILLNVSEIITKNDAKISFPDSSLTINGALKVENFEGRN